MSAGLLVSSAGGIKRITFNRSERRNAVDAETVRAFRDAILACADDDCRVVVLTGAGEAFCSGADLQAHGDSSLADRDITAYLREEINPTILAMRALPKPIIARVHGPAAGVGCNYALACDMIIASEQARFGQVFVKIGLMPDGGGTFLLPRIVGYVKAFELLATGAIIDAREALALGIVNRVVPLEELDGAVDDLANRLAAGPAIALAKVKQALNHAENCDLPAALDFEAVNQKACYESADFAEGVAAFIEKRKPKFG